MRPNQQMESEVSSERVLINLFVSGHMALEHNLRLPGPISMAGGAERVRTYLPGCLPRHIGKVRAGSIFHFLCSMMSSIALLFWLPNSQDFPDGHVFFSNSVV